MSEYKKKRIAGIASFTLRGALLEDKIMKVLGEDYRFIQYENGLKAWCALCFDAAEVLIFIGAAGIAVRTIASFIKSKTEDPAVVVIDEAGNYVISLLSGHIGGANEFAEKLAQKIGATPVVTTASDVNGLVAVDVFAKKNHLAISSMKDAKTIAAATLEGKTIGLYCDGTVQDDCPPQWILLGKNENSDTDGTLNITAGQENRKVDHLIWISPYLPDKNLTEKYMANTEGTILHLVPSCVYLGVGCRKEKDAESIFNGLEKVITETGISESAIVCAASIDLKKEEKGILAYCEAKKLPFLTYTAEELASVPGEFKPSEFVKKTTGVDNVCERSALAAAGSGSRLIHEKYAENGVTAALALQEWRIHFEE